MSGEPLEKLDSEPSLSGVYADSIQEFNSTLRRFQKYRLTLVRAVLEICLFGSMLFCWHTGHLRLGLACLIAWAIADHLTQKYRSAFDPSVRDVAGRIERFDLRLQGRLYTALEQIGRHEEFSYVQLRLFKEVAELAGTGNWQQCVSSVRFAFASFALRGAQFFAFVAAMLFIFDRKERQPGSAPAEIQAKAAEVQAVVLPGNTELEKGTRLSVSARLLALAPDVFLVTRETEPGSGGTVHIGMGQAVGEPLYGASVESVEKDLEYWVETAFGSSEHFVAKVFEFPSLETSHALALFPKGTEPAERRFENARKLTVPEGTSVDWELRFNKPVKTVRLVHQNGVTDDLSPDFEGKVCVWRLQALERSVETKLEIADAEGRGSKSQVEFRIQVLPNAPAKIRPLLPRGDARFTLVEEVDFEAEVWDDSGLLRWGVGIQLGADEVQELVLGSGAPGGQKIKMHRLEAFEEKGMRVGDSVSWFFWAEDLDGSGRVRRTESDLYLGRIRAFEEEYRQDDSEEEGKGSGGPQLLELQKQVIAATWNLKRSIGAAAKLKDEAEKNLGIVGASEARVLELAQEKAESENSDAHRAHYKEAIVQLEKAVRELRGSASDAARISAAIEAERAAYDALAHVAPSSYVMKQSRKPSAGKMEEKTNQMNNLDFAKQEDRYQSKSEAMSEKEQEERTQMEELLAQLRSLARRQDEVLERMRELESRIRETMDEKEREASKRELKKLSDEQKALAHELENAQQKASERNEALAQQTQEMDAARQAAQRAAAALEKGALDEARASASRSAEKLRAGGDALRQQLSGRTREAARELQERAQELASEEKKIAGALESQKKGPSRLSEDGVGKEVESQRKRLKMLQEQMQRAAEATEISEPLFSKALQDAHRSTVQNQIELKLKVVEDALAARRQDVAQRAEKSAAEDVQELARAVEKAADDVLGDDAQALRQARAAVEKIARELSERSGVAMNSPPLGPGGPERAAIQSGDGANHPPDRRSEGDGDSGSDGKEAVSHGGPENAVAGPSKSASVRRPEGEVVDQNAKVGEEGKGVASGGAKEDGASKKSELSRAGKGNSEERQDGGNGAISRGQGESDSKSAIANSRVGQASDPQAAQSASSNSSVGSGDSKDSSSGFNRKSGVASTVAREDHARDAGGNAVQSRNESALGAGYAGGWGVPAQDLGDWLNRLDRVDALLERPQLRAGVARVQQAAEELRAEIKRNASRPSQHQIQQNLMAPLTELRDAISAELARREGRENEAPVDRDPVPRKYEASVRRYYEALGGGK
jgi:hypothetical protein